MRPDQQSGAAWQPKCSGHGGGQTAAQSARSNNNSLEQVRQMRFHAVSGAAARRRTDCAIVGIHVNGALAASAVPLDARLDGRLARLAKRGDLRGRIGETTLLDVDGGPCQRVLVVGIGGKKGALTRKQYKKAMLAAAAALVRSGARDAVSFLSLETVSATDSYYRGRLAAEAEI